jgi:acyl-[acyl-carrier-protein] desaturase
MARVGADENMHFLFYRDLTTAAIELNPSRLVIAIDDVVRNFAMPGTGIADFNKHAARIAEAGIYDLNLFCEQILQPVILRHWGLEKLEGLTPEADEARTRVLAHMERLTRLSQRLVARRAKHESPALAG